MTCTFAITIVAAAAAAAASSGGAVNCQSRHYLAIIASSLMTA